MAKTTVFNKINSFLKEKNIEYKILEHDKIHTVEDGARIRGTKIEQAAKALILKTKSKKFFMLVVPGNMRASLKIVKKLVEEKNVSLASPDEVYEITGLKVGSIPPFGPFFGLKTYFEKELLKQKIIIFSAGSHYKSIMMKPQDLVKTLNIKLENFCELNHELN